MQQAHEQDLVRHYKEAKATKRNGWHFRSIREMHSKPMTPKAIANLIVLETGEKLISHESIYRWGYEDWQRRGAVTA